MDSLEIKDKKAQLKQRALEMTDLCRQEIRMMTDEEQSEYDSIIKQIKTLNSELKELERSLLNSDEETKEIRQTKIENKQKMEKRFSLVNAIAAIANNQLLDDTTMAVAAAGKEEMRKAGLSMGGQIQIPTNLENRDVISVTAEGEDIVPTDLFDIMPALRAKNVLVQAGARFLNNLVGNVQIPIMTGANVGWETELGAAQDGAGSFDSVTLSPFRLTCFIDISKQLLVQDAIGVEEMIRQDLINAINSKLEATILGDGDGMGTGASASVQVAPKGIFNGATVEASVNSMAKFAELEAGVEAANVIGECKYIIAPSVKATLRTKAKGENIAQSLYVNNEIDGTPALSTGHVKANHLVYGDFSNLAIASWGPLDLCCDCVSQAVYGKVRIIVNAYFDAKILRPEAFKFGKTVA